MMLFHILLFRKSFHSELKHTLFERLYGIRVLEMASIAIISL
jgi:hypothetical protein